MQIHKEFVDTILKRRMSYVDRLLVGDNSINLDKEIDIKNRLNQLDRIAYTIEFLEKNGFIEVFKVGGLVNNGLFNFKVEELESEIENYFQASKLRDDFNVICGWRISSKPGLIVFRVNGYRTDEQLREDRTIKLTIGAALLASFATAVLTTYGNWLIQSC